jgi:putative endonuclease
LFTVYAISSISKNYIYVGLTIDVQNRLKRHNSGYEKATRSYKPFELLYCEEHQSRIKAREREKYLKSGVGKEFLKNLLKKK